MGLGYFVSPSPRAKFLQVLYREIRGLLEVVGYPSDFRVFGVEDSDVHGEETILELYLFFFEIGLSLS